MLVDINAYVGQWPFRQLIYNSCEGLIERMNHFGIDISVISSLNGIFLQNTQPANEQLYKELISKKNFQERLIAFAVINPIYAGWKNDLEICSNSFGMKGVRLYPKYHGYELSNPSCIELVKMARDRGLPVALSMRMVDARPSSWLDLERNTEWNLKDVIPLLKEVPDAKYLILNVANSARLNEEETSVLKKADLLMDTSGRAMNELPDLINNFGIEKFGYGTHSPILDNVTARLRIETLKETEAGVEGKKLLRSGNALKFLGVNL